MDAKSLMLVKVEELEAWVVKRFEETGNMLQVAEECQDHLHALWADAGVIAAEFCTKYQLQVTVDEETLALSFAPEHDPLLLIKRQDPNFDREFGEFQEFLAIECIGHTLAEGIANILLENVDAGH